MKPLITCVLGALVAILAGAAHPAAASFPGQNGRVAFASNRSGTYDIFTARPDGSSLLNLTATAGVDELDPAWSADGRRLAFTRDGSIWVMDADGGGRAQLTPGSPAGEIDSGPAWSPAGAELAFARSDTSGNSGIWTIGLGGGPLRRLTTRTGDTGQDLAPSWSPDGSTIAFQRNFRGSAARLALVDTAAGRVVEVDTGITSGNAHPAWSPDGTRIAIDVNGGEGIAVFEPNGTRVLLPVLLFGSDPEWSPDGSAIVYASDDEVTWAALDGSASGSVSGAVGVNRSPSWQPAPTGPPASNTPAGTNVVFASGAVTITFASVLAAGDTTVVSAPTGPAVPGYFQLASDYYELATTAAWDASAGAQVCFAYSGSPAPQIVHFVGGVATLVATTAGPGAQVCGTVSSFSPFVLVRPAADTLAPALSLPASRVVNAASPAGAVVAFAVSATDDLDPSPVVGCLPPSGSTFPIGQTTVACTARDASGNVATGTFAVTVKGAKAQLADLMQKVVGASQLPPAAKTLLISRLNQLLASFDPTNAAQRQAVCVSLNVFKAAVQLQAGRTIPAPQAADWIADANRIRSVLGC